MNTLELLAWSDWSVGSVVFQRCLRYVLGHFLTSAEISRKNPDHYPERMPLFLSISSSFIISEFLGRTEIKLSTLLQGQTAGMFTESISIWFCLTPLHSFTRIRGASKASLRQGNKFKMFFTLDERVFNVYAK